jgi:hypothetical protein
VITATECIITEAEAALARLREPDERAGCTNTYEGSLWGSVLAELKRLHKLVNTPEIVDFAKAVQLEAVFQREKWGADGDEGKTDADWFWLIGYLAGKALHNPGDLKNPEKKRLHRIITIAAAAANWHAAVLGTTDMRPGIETPKGESA